MSQVVLVAFSVDTDNSMAAQVQVQQALKHALDHVESWWIAEDNRIDGSDNDSAVFVHKGTQQVAYSVLEIAELTGSWNVRSPEGRRPNGSSGPL